jgi:indolepyruvate ferredoxin oxidoreductase
MIADYRNTVLALLDTLSADRLALAVEIAALPEKVRGFGHVKKKATAQFCAEQESLLKKYAAPQSGLHHAA